MIPAYVIVEGIEALPTLPEAVARLTMLLRNEQASTSDFEQAVRSDPAVTANLLKAANSVFYQAIEPITSVSQAVARIGLKRVFEVAIGTSFRRAMPARIYGYGIEAPAFWLHCTATAVFAEVLGHKCGLPSPDIAFTAGLLHDVGKLVVGRFLEELMPESNWWAFGTAAAERELLGSNHCEVGYEIASRWRLPLPVAQACRWHHEPVTGVDGVDTDLTAAVHIADHLAYLAGFPGSGGKEEAIVPQALLRLKLNQEQLEGLAERYKEEILRMSHATSLSAA